MSILFNTFDSKIARTAYIIDLLEACQHHKLPDDRKKHKALAATIRQNSTELTSIFAEQRSKGDTNEFTEKVKECITIMRAQRAAVVKHRRERREQNERERAEVLADIALAA